MKLSLGDYSQCGAKKQTSKQKVTTTEECLAGVHKEQVLWFPTSERHYPSGTASLGRFPISRLYPILCLKKGDVSGLWKKKENLSFDLNTDLCEGFPW